MKNNKVLVLDKDIDIVLPFRTFDHNFIDFRGKHREDEDETWLTYSVNSDGKFRLELKEKPEDEDYILRISGQKSKDRRPTLHFRRIYFNEIDEQQILPMYDYVTDFIDQLEVWALDNKGNFYLKYMDFEEQTGHTVCIRKGLAKELPFSAQEENQLLFAHGYTRRS